MSTRQGPKRIPDRPQAFICTACGTQHAPSATPPASCDICADERQFVPVSGQGWTTLDRLRRTHMATFRDDTGILGIGTSPAFAIGQRALLVRSSGGNVLWDCISLISAEMVELLAGLGGLRAIAISHPHFYSSMLEWSRAFGDVPVYLHADDRAWVRRGDGNIVFWEGDVLDLGDGMTLVRTGGHFEGSAVLHWAGGAAGRGALLTGDSLQVVPDRRHVGFMRSYPNLVPLGAAAIRRIAARLSAFRFETIHGGFWDRVIAEGAEEALRRSVERNIAWLERDAGDPSTGR